MIEIAIAFFVGLVAGSLGSIFLCRQKKTFQVNTHSSFKELPRVKAYAKVKGGKRKPVVNSDEKAFVLEQNEKI